MKKIIAIFLMLSVCIGVVGCNKKEAKPTLAKPTLSSAMAIFNDMSASYDDKMYPYEFTEAELAAADEETRSLAKSLYTTVCVAQDISENYTELEAINTFILIDYVFRPAFLLDKEKFQESFKAIEDDMMHSGDGDYFAVAVQCYLETVRPDAITNEMISCAVPIIREFEPDVTETVKYSTAEEAYVGWATHMRYSRVIGKLLWAGDDKAAAKAYDAESAEIGQRWIELISSLRSDS